MVSFNNGLTVRIWYIRYWVVYLLSKSNKMKFRIRGIGWVRTWKENDLRRYCDGLHPEIFDLDLNKSLKIGNSTVTRIK